MNLAGVVLAAGEGRRLRPLTELRPKALCPVNNVPLVDHAIARLWSVTDAVAVNIHSGRGVMENHLAGIVHMSLETGDSALGTAGAIGHLRGWIDGRGVAIANADAWYDGLDTLGFADGWRGETARLLVVAAGDHEPDLVRDGNRWRFAGLSLMPWSLAESIAAEPAGLWEAVWSHLDAGRLELVEHRGAFFDCGTPGDYLEANLAALDLAPATRPFGVSGGPAHANVERSVVGPGAVIEEGAEVAESVVWPGAVVESGERLVRSIRARAPDGSSVTVTL